MADNPYASLSAALNTRRGDTLAQVGSQDPNLVYQALASLVRGAHRDPILGWGMEQLVDVLPGVDRRDLEQFQSAALSGTGGDLLELIGEWGPTLIGGIGAYTAGRAAGKVGMRLLAGELAKKGSGSALGRQGITMMQRLSADMAGSTLGHIPKPALERAGEIAGGALGSGVFEGARATAAGEDPQTIALQAALATGLVGGFDTALTGAARLLGAAGTGSTLVPRKGLAGADELGALASKVKARGNRLTKLSDALDNVLGVEATERGLADFFTTHGMLGEAGAHTYRARKAAAQVERLKPIVGRAEQALAQSKSTLEAGRKFFTAVNTAIGTDMTKSPLSPIRSMLPEEMQQLVNNAAMTPEGVARSGGSIAFNKFIHLTSALEDTLSIARAATDEQTAWMYREAGKALGLNPFKRSAKALWAKQVDPKFTERVREVFDDFERLGVEEAAKKWPGMKPVWDKYKALGRVYEEVERLGGEKALRLGPAGEDTARLGVREWIGHLVDFDQPEKVIRERLLNGLVTHFKKRGMSPEMAEAQARSIAAEYLDGIKGPRLFATTDFQRRIPGTLKDLVESGLPFIDDPIRAWGEAANGIYRRMYYGSTFGWKHQMGEVIKRQAIREGLPAATANTMVDHVLARKLQTQGMRRFAQNVTNLQTLTKMTWGWIPNLAQTGNTMALVGVRPTLRAIYQTMKGRLGASDEALSLIEESWQANRRLFSGLSRETTLDAAARRSLFLFTPVERFNIQVAELAAIYDMKRTLGLAWSGRLRGTSLDAARRRFAQYRLDLDDLTRRGKDAFKAGGMDEGMSAVFRPGKWLDGVLVEPGDLDLALFRASKLSQFQPDITRRPLYWQTPWGRLLFQFKTFAMQQGRFFRDQVLGEAAQGNLKPLAYFASFYPVAGELVGQAYQGIKGRERDTEGFDRLLENYLMMGGLGLASSFAFAAQHGRTYDALLGPTVADMTQLVEAILTADPERAWNQLKRQPVVRGIELAVGAGAMGLEETGSWLEALGDGSGQRAGKPYDAITWERLQGKR